MACALPCWHPPTLVPACLPCPTRPPPRCPPPHAPQTLLTSLPCPRRWMLDNDITGALEDLVFAEEVDYFGRKSVVELRAGGKDVKVGAVGWVGRCGWVLRVGWLVWRGTLQGGKMAGPGGPPSYRHVGPKLVLTAPLPLPPALPCTACGTACTALLYRRR